ncbi:hypothetical protein MON38_09070 [Hymenobacter sp. DH14]|uniref:Uncharacterized protein n=1 Tax=Hymenobacter cyanobacteriorum TaxID=2926463 RepID=A0A9X2AIB5_9BACT|nr:hypothetical protein [Hymenobacter cyanobacteriorum]MCI1187569.1 hypothetical protein [Hymenobacter cyanobacteriorum]
MSTDNIDDLFRRQLDGHATPPGDDLWARLQAGPGAAAPAPEPAANATPERVDELYKERLKTHVTLPSRKVWERLEDEHLRPRKRRPAAWWPMAMAAAVALLLLAGGAGLWLGWDGGGRGSAGTVASQPGNGSRLSDSHQPTAADKSAALPTNNDRRLDKPGTAQTGLAANTATSATEAAAATNATAGQNIARTSQTTISGLNQKNLPARATRPAGPASSASKVGMMAQQSPRRPQGASRQPDAVAANTSPLVARTTPQPTIPTRTRPADEPAQVATTTLPAPTPAGENVPAATASSLAAATLITVDVRNGAARRPSLATAVATAAAAATDERRGLGGRLLRQVGHAVRGERISLSEVTGLPENLTLEANIIGRHVSKSIQL